MNITKPLTKIILAPLALTCVILLTSNKEMNNITTMIISLQVPNLLMADVIEKIKNETK